MRKEYQRCSFCCCLLLKDLKGRSKQTVRWTVCPPVAFPQKSKSNRGSQKKDIFGCLFSSYICLRQVILLCSYIRLTPSDIVLRTVNGKYNITFELSKISLQGRWNITWNLCIQTIRFFKQKRETPYSVSLFCSSISLMIFFVCINFKRAVNLLF